MTIAPIEGKSHTDIRRRVTANKTISDIFIAKLSTCAMNKYQLYLHITFTIGNMPTVATLISDGLCSGHSLLNIIMPNILKTF